MIPSINKLTLILYPKDREIIDRLFEFGSTNRSEQVYDNISLPNEVLDQIYIQYSNGKFYMFLKSSSWGFTYEVCKEKNISDFQFINILKCIIKYSSHGKDVTFEEPPAILIGTIDINDQIRNTLGCCISSAPYTDEQLDIMLKINYERVWVYYMYNYGYSKDFIVQWRKEGYDIREILRRIILNEGKYHTKPYKYEILVHG